MYHVINVMHLGHMIPTEPLLWQLAKVQSADSHCEKHQKRFPWCLYKYNHHISLYQNKTILSLSQNLKLRILSSKSDF